MIRQEQCAEKAKRGNALFFGLKIMLSCFHCNKIYLYTGRPKKTPLTPSRNCANQIIQGIFRSKMMIKSVICKRVQKPI